MFIVLTQLTKSNIMNLYTLNMQRSPNREYNDFIDLEVFTFTHYYHTEPTSFIHSIYMTGYEYNATIFSGEFFQQLQNDIRGLTIATFAAELNISVVLNNGCTFSIMLKQFHNKHNSSRKHGLRNEKWKC